MSSIIRLYLTRSCRTVIAHGNTSRVLSRVKEMNLKAKKYGEGENSFVIIEGVDKETLPSGKEKVVDEETGVVVREVKW